MKIYTDLVRLFVNVMLCSVVVSPTYLAVTYYLPMWYSVTYPQRTSICWFLTTNQHAIDYATRWRYYLCSYVWPIVRSIYDTRAPARALSLTTGSEWLKWRIISHRSSTILNCTSIAPATRMASWLFNVETPESAADQWRQEFFHHRPRIALLRLGIAAHCRGPNNNVITIQ